MSIVAKNSIYTICDSLELGNFTTLKDINKNLSMKDIDIFYEKLGNLFDYQYLNYEYIQKLNISKNFTLNIKFSFENLNEFKFFILNETTVNIDIAIDNPFKYEEIEELKSIFNKKVNFILINSETMQFLLAQFKKNNLEFIYNEDIGEDIEVDFNFNFEAGIDIIGFVRKIIIDAYQNKVSDIHLEPTENSFDIRFRIDGILENYKSIPKELKDKVQREVISRIKILCDMDVAEKRKPQDGRLPNDKVLPNKKVPFDIRVSTFPTVYGEKVVLRILDKDALKPKLEDLGMGEKMLKIFKNRISSPYGFILVTGPTGSGKTTTLYSALSNVDKKEKNVLTIEDPVEYRLDGTHQMQVNSKIGLNFATGLRTILRQDPDVIMVGEIRDLETANMAIRASLTGHIVFSTLHTNDAIGVVLRLKNIGIEPFLIADSLTLAIAQRLVRRVCNNCRILLNKKELKSRLKKEGIDEEKIKNLNIDIDNLEIDTFAYGRGCSKCKYTGYKGRVAIFELFEIKDNIKSEIVRSDFSEDRMKTIAIKQNGMKTLHDNARVLFINGTTTIEELIRVIGEE